MSAKIDMVGKRFGKLVVIKEAPKRSDKIYWECLCDCGNICEKYGGDLRSGHVISCGCASSRNGKDIAGKRFGKLVALEKTSKKSSQGIIWKCQCDCGNICERTVSSLQSAINHNKIPSCGCYNIEILDKYRNTGNRKRVEQNITNQRFGRLVALEPTKKIQKSSTVWKCQCDCGNTCERSVFQLNYSVTHDQIASCGCYKKEKLAEASYNTHFRDLTGQRFGKLIAIKYIPQNTENNPRSLWECECDCGNIVKIETSNLLTGNSKSCGCGRSFSYGVEKIKLLLNDNEINYKTEYTFSDCRFKDTNYLARYDFYLSDYNCLIEYDGRQHSIQGEGNYDNLKKFQKTQEHDQFKNDYALSHNIPLIRIPYTHFDNIALEDLLPATSKFIIV